MDDFGIVVVVESFDEVFSSFKNRALIDVPLVGDLAECSRERFLDDQCPARCGGSATAFANQ